MLNDICHLHVSSDSTSLCTLFTVSSKDGKSSARSSISSSFALSKRKKNHTYKCNQCIPSSILANKPSLMDSGLARAAVTSATSFLLV